MYDTLPFSESCQKTFKSIKNIDINKEMAKLYKDQKNLHYERRTDTIVVSTTVCMFTYCLVSAIGFQLANNRLYGASD